MELVKKHYDYMQALAASINSGDLDYETIIDSVDSFWNEQVRYNPNLKSLTGEPWSTPVETLEYGEGACQDIATGKYLDLKNLGCKPQMQYCSLDRGYHLRCICSGIILDVQSDLVTPLFTFDSEIAQIGNIIKPSQEFIPEWGIVLGRLNL